MSTASRRGAAPPPPAPAPVKGRQSAYQIEKGLKQSLESVDAGLKKFLASMKGSGMAEALQGYRTMQTVLVQQRLWAHSNGRTALAPLFRSIAQTAGELHRIFSGYAEAMRPLKELDKLTRIDAQATRAAAQAPTSAAVAPEQPAKPAEESPEEASAGGAAGETT